MTQLNILTVDVEDWYMDLDILKWELFEDRVVASTSKILNLLEKEGINGTFFIVGYVAERFPELIEEIRDRGNEIATHGYSHTSILRQNPKEFECDLQKSISILRNLSKEDIVAHRACEFSIVEETAWAIDILKRNNIMYDSSVVPAKTYLYGVNGAPKFPYYIDSSDIKKAHVNGDLVELPISSMTIPFLKRNVPIAGGFYLRFLPYDFIKFSIKKIHMNAKPFICYVHPWEFDPQQPRIQNLKPFHYFGLSSTERKFKKLLRDFRFTSIKEWMENE